MAVEHQELKKQDKKLQANYSTYLNEFAQDSTIMGDEFTEAKKFYENRSATLTKSFTDLFAVEEKTDQILQPNLEKIQNSLDEVEEKKYIKKRGLLKTGVEVTNRKEILEARDVNRSLVRKEAYKYSDTKAKFRRELPNEIKAAVGDYETMTCLSDFYMDMMLLDESLAADKFSSLAKNYGGTSENEAENMKQRFSAMDELTGMIMKIDLKSINLSSDEAIAKNAASLERICGMTKSFETLLNNNPDYLAELNTRKNEDGSSFGEKLSERMGILGAVSDYYRVKKLLISDETYSGMLNSEIGMERKATDRFQLARLKKLQRAAYYLGQNLSAKTNKAFVQMPLETEIGSLEEEDDMALRLLSTDPGQQDYFDSIQREKVEKLHEERIATDKALLKAIEARDSFVNKNSAEMEKNKARIKELNALEEKNKGKLKELDEKKSKLSDERWKLKGEISSRKTSVEQKAQKETELKEKEKEISELNKQIEELAGREENSRLSDIVYKYDKALAKLDEDVSYHKEEVSIIEGQISYERKLTDRERINRVINNLEAESFYVPEKWDKMSLDAPERNTDPNLIEACSTSTNGYLSTYTKKTGRQPIRDFINKYKVENSDDPKKKIALPSISFDGLAHRYAKPSFDSFDRSLDHFAGAYGYGYTNEEMIEQFEIYADLNVPKKKAAIFGDPKLKAYYESAYKDMVKRQHHQIYSVIQRIKNGLGDVPFALTPVDFIMQINEMIRSELMALSIYSNPYTDDNVRYIRQLFKEDHSGKYNVDVDVYGILGGSYGNLAMGCQNYLDRFYNTDDIGFFTEEEKIKINKFVTDYKKKHPDSGLSNVDIRKLYAKEHIDEFNTSAKLMRRCESAEMEEIRVDTLHMKKNVMIPGDVVKDLQQALKMGLIPRSDEKKLLEYNEKLKRECPEAGFTGLKTNGQDDPFLILRLLDDFKLTDEEKKKFNPKDPEKLKFADWSEIILKEKER